MNLTRKFCSCIPKVRKTLKKGSRKDKTGRSIAICVRSVLQTRGKTLKKFNCGMKRLETQPIKR